MKIIALAAILSVASMFAGIGFLHVGQLTGYIGVLTSDGIHK